MAWWRRNRANLGLVTLSIAIGVVAAEVTLRVIGYQYTPLSIEVLSENDRRLFHAFEDDFFVYDPDLIWRPKRSHSVFNSQGFRGPELSAAKKPGTLRIFTIGDSNTLGWAGEDGPNWPQYLQDALQEDSDRYVVVNAAAWGYSSYQGLVRFREVLAFEPDIVLISFGSNDAHVVTMSDREFAEQAGDVYGISRFLNRFRLGQVILSLVNRGEAMEAQGQKPRVGLEEYRRNLKEIAAEAGASGIGVVLLTRPYTGSLGNDLRWKHFGHDYNLATVEVAADQNLLLVDVYSFFKGKEHLFSDESHFTDEGHRLAARMILENMAPILDHEPETVRLP